MPRGQASAAWGGQQRQIALRAAWARSARNVLRLARNALDSRTVTQQRNAAQRTRRSTTAWRAASSLGKRTMLASSLQCGTADWHLRRRRRLRSAAIRSRDPHAEPLCAPHAARPSAPIIIVANQADVVWAALEKAVRHQALHSLQNAMHSGQRRWSARRRWQVHTCAQQRRGWRGPDWTRRIE